MAKLTKSQTQETSTDSKGTITLQQQNNFYNASEIDALNRLQKDNPELAKKILSLKEQEINNQKKIIEIEENEQQLRKNELPYIRKFNFRGQFMAFMLGIISLGCAAFFVYYGHDTAGIAFLTSTVIVAFMQYNNKLKK